MVGALNDENPFSEYVLAGESKVKKILVIFLKILTPLYLILDKNLKYQVPFLVCLTLMVLLLIVFLHLSKNQNFFSYKL